MEYKQSLARRIVIAFMLMTVAVGGLFSAGIVGVVHIIEERLISRDLGGELERILRDDLAQDATRCSIPACASSSATARALRHAAGAGPTGCRFPRSVRGRLVVPCAGARYRWSPFRPAAGPERFRSARAGALRLGADRLRAEHRPGRPAWLDARAQGDGAGGAPGAPGAASRTVARSGAAVGAGLRQRRGRRAGRFLRRDPWPPARRAQARAIVHQRRQSSCVRR